VEEFHTPHAQSLHIFLYGRRSKTIKQFLAKRNEKSEKENFPENELKLSRKIITIIPNSKLTE
jgi:hypothetical protein